LEWIIKVNYLVADDNTGNGNYALYLCSIGNPGYEWSNIIHEAMIFSSIDKAKSMCRGLKRIMIISEDEAIIKYLMSI
jgi:hypothetical protein